jgi:hypothetical protein
VFVYFDTRTKNEVELAKWIFNGTGRSWNTRSADGDNNWDKIHIIPSTGDNDISAISGKGMQGIYPVDTKTEVGGIDHNLGRDIFKKYWNTQDKWNTNNPTYPDDFYHLSLLSVDIRGNKKWADKDVQWQILDNFKPYIKKVLVYTVKNGYEIKAYSAEWCWQGGSLVMDPTGDGCDKRESVRIHIISSEPLHNIEFDINGLKTYKDKADKSEVKIEWVFEIDSEYLQDLNQITISEKSTDLAGNALFGFKKDQTLLAGTLLPKRKNDGKWSDNSKGKDGTDDESHVFGGKLIGQYICNKPPLGLTADYKADGSGDVIIAWGPPDYVNHYEYKVYKSWTETDEETDMEEISNGWIKQLWWDDKPDPRNEWTGAELFYYVIANEIVTENSPNKKSAKIIKKKDDEQCIASTSIVLEDDDSNNNECFETSIGGPYGENNSVDFMLWTDCVEYNGYYEVDFYLTEESEPISDVGFDWYFRVSDLGDMFEPITYTPYAIVHINPDNDVDDITVDFGVVTIEPVAYELEINITNDLASVGLPITITVDCPNARAGDYDIAWSWCLDKIEDNSVACEDPNHETTKENTFSISHNFSEAGSYLFSVQVINDINGKHSDTHTKTITVSENCIQASITPDFEDYCYFPSDCDNQYIRYTIPPEYKVGYCGEWGSGEDYYLTKVRIYEAWQLIDSVDFEELYDNEAGDDLHIKNEWNSNNWEWALLLNRLAVNYKYVDMVYDKPEGFHAIGFEVIGKKYSKQNGTFWGSEKSHIIHKYYKTMGCSSLFVCDTKTIRDAQINSYQYSSLSNQHGFFVIEGDGGLVENVEEWNVVARKSVLLNSGVNISNSKFKASVISCDYSICDILQPDKYYDKPYKSVLIAEPFIDDLSESIIQNIQVYPNPVCDFLNIDFIESDKTTISHIEISDMSGRIVKKVPALSINSSINVEDLRLGVYIISITSSGEVHNYKFVKE